MLEQVRALITKHCGTLVGELEAIRGCLDGLDRPEIDNADVLADGIDYAHKIKGSSGSIGFPEISAAAAALEFCLREIAHRGGVTGAVERDRIFNRYAKLDRLVRSITPEQSTLFNMPILMNSQRSESPGN